jgi:hypothetical protein
MSNIMLELEPSGDVAPAMTLTFYLERFYNRVGDWLMPDPHLNKYWFFPGARTLLK